MASKDVLSEDDDDRVDGQGTSNQSKDDEKDDVAGVEVVESPEETEDQEDSQVELSGEAEEEHDRRRETARERRERAKRARERDRKELDFQNRVIRDLESKIDALAKETAATRIGSLDQQINEAEAEARRFAAIRAAAITQGNGQDVIDAETVQRDAEQRYAMLKAQREQVARAVQQPSPNQTVPWVDDAKRFVSDKPWYDPQGRDEDSAIVLAIDKNLSNEGFKPTGPEYWAELERRVAKRLPHRYKNKTGSTVSREADEDYGDDTPETDTRTRRAPPVAGGRSSTSGGQNKIYLSPNRVQAMKDAGIWDDPAMRKRMALKYAEFDRNNSSARR